MLTLFLLRHAKSSWDHPGLEDFSRPLAPRGLDAAPRMGAHIAGAFDLPQLILCSTAERTRATLDLVTSRWPATPKVTFEDDLYLAPASQLLARLRRVSAATHRLMLVGHNPGLHDLAHGLAGAGDAAARASLAEKFPTAAFAVVTFKTDAWRTVANGSGTLVHYKKPSQLLEGHAA